MIVAIPIAANKNTPTATNERILKRANPQSPCPLVQPLPNLLPNPTIIPDNAKPKNDVYLEIFYFSPNGAKFRKVRYPKISKNIPLAIIIPPIIISLLGS